MAKGSGDVVIDVDEEDEDVDDDNDDADENQDAVRGVEGARKNKKNKRGPSGGGETGLPKRPRVDEPRATSAPGQPQFTMASTTRARVRKLLLLITCVTNNI